MKLVTASQMQALDRAAIETHKIPSLELMERAGVGVSDTVAKSFPKKGLAVIFVGKGNNGGDGLVAARHLKKAGFDVLLVLLSPWTDLSKDSRANWDKLAGLGVEVSEELPAERCKKATVIVDSIFGTGLSNEVKGKYRNAIELINSLSRPVVAVDIPSGLSADTGKPLGVAVKADQTVTFGAVKLGLAIGGEYAGKIVLVDIGIPDELMKGAETGYHLISEDMFRDHFGKRPADFHKGDAGHVLVAAGSLGKIGAGLLASRAALRSGAGLVTYALPASAYLKFDTKAPEIMYEGVEDGGSGYFSKRSISQLKALSQTRDVLAIGPGVGTEKETAAAVSEMVKKSILPVVIDADGLNCVASNPSSFSSRKKPVVMTPHPGEMSRLTGLATKKIQDDRISVAKVFAKEHKVLLVLKGNRTIVAFPDGNVFINPTGNPGMATAGTGDVLTGMIAGFIAQKVPVDKAVLAAVYLHGLSGDLAVADTGERGMIASDLISAIPKAMKRVNSD